MGWSPDYPQSSNQLQNILFMGLPLPVTLTSWNHFPVKLSEPKILSQVGCGRKPNKGTTTVGLLLSKCTLALTLTVLTLGLILEETKGQVVQLM